MHLLGDEDSPVGRECDVGGRGEAVHEWLVIEGGVEHGGNHWRRGRHVGLRQHIEPVEVRANSSGGTGECDEQIDIARSQCNVV